MKHYCLVLSFFLLNSCAFKGSFGGLVSCYKKTNKEAPSLIKPLPKEASLCDYNYSDSLKVIKTNALKLKKCLQEEEKAFVYSWNINCSSELCFDLELLQAACHKKGYSLFIVAQYYDTEGMLKNHELQFPIIGIDTKYYKSNFTDKYLKRFKRELTGEKEEFWERLMYFEKGKFIKAVDRIEEV